MLGESVKLAASMIAATTSKGSPKIHWRDASGTQSSLADTHPQTCSVDKPIKRHGAAL
jgi:hypothetical protein